MTTLRRFSFLLTACSLQLVAFSQYWQQRVDYTIDVALNDKEKTLDGFEKLLYSNQSPDTLRYIWFHIWPNAYKNDQTAFSEQRLLNNDTRFYFASKEQRGYINRLDFKVDGVTAKTEDHPQYIDVIKVVLPQPLLPGKQIVLTTPFHVKLPFNFSRGGYSGETFQATQWYPKPAVYDKNGWHPMPYLDQGEFYSEFGRYDVRITLPASYVVATTGTLQTASEKEWLKGRTASTFDMPPKPAKQSPNKGNVKSKVVVPPPAPETPLKTLQYIQDSVHDFAWFADKYFIVDQDTCQLPGGKVIEVFSYYPPSEQKGWKNSTGYLKDAVRFYSAEVGEYPYSTVSAVSGPASFGGGMEYPTITLITPINDPKDLDITIAHEVGHNWFYGVLATSEREHPWMDEGINSYYEKKYTRLKYGEGQQAEEILFQTIASNKTDQPIETPAALFSWMNYGLIAYHKTAEWMKYLESSMGAEAFRETMQTYYRQWRFKHPQPGDFKELVRQRLGQDTNPVFALLNTKGVLPNHYLTGFAVVSPISMGSISRYLKHPVKDILVLSPVLGVNSYDKIMVGGLASNYKLPPNKFSYLVAPMYGTGSKRFTGSGRINYSIATDGVVRKTDLFLNGSMFSMNQYSDSAGKDYFMQFQKLVPGLRLTFRENDTRSSARRYIQWKTFLIGEEEILINPEKRINGTDTSIVLHYSTPREKRYLNQLQMVWENNRALYPFLVAGQVDQAMDFIRPTITVEQFFNYPKEGGLQVRLFAGTFIYRGEMNASKQFANDRYFLNMTGANGFEDYTYSDYFIGRNRYEGFNSQQIMIRDGGFKVRTDLLANKVGKTDTWLASINLNSSIPNGLNPLSVLPITIPLRLFVDIGTYGDVWQHDASGDRFLFDAGIHIPLFNDAFNLYVPVLYSKVYSDYFKSTITEQRFLKTMSFSININKAFKKLNEVAEF